MSKPDNTLIKQQLFTVADFVRYGASQFNQAELFFGHGTNNAWHEAIVLVMFALALPDEMYDDAKQCRLTDEEKDDVLAIFTARIEQGVPAAYITNFAKFAGLPFLC